jgi:hypothetical protein
MELYHYTIADRLIKIILDGYLKLSPKEPMEGEPSLVWFTKKDEWDNTAFFGYSKEVLMNAGMVRITVDKDEVEAVESYLKFLEPKQYKQFGYLVISALSVNVNYKDWYVTDKIVERKYFKKIEFWINDNWVEIKF